jgi:hypothetical protein
MCAGRKRQSAPLLPGFQVKVEKSAMMLSRGESNINGISMHELAMGLVRGVKNATVYMGLLCCSRCSAHEIEMRRGTLKLRRGSIGSASVECCDTSEGGAGHAALPEHSRRYKAAASTTLGPGTGCTFDRALSEIRDGREAALAPGLGSAPGSAPATPAAAAAADPTRAGVEGTFGSAPIARPRPAAGEARSDGDAARCCEGNATVLDSDLEQVARAQERINGLLAMQLW